MRFLGIRVRAGNELALIQSEARGTAGERRREAAYCAAVVVRTRDLCRVPAGGNRRLLDSEVHGVARELYGIEDLGVGSRCHAIVNQGERGAAGWRVGGAQGARRNVETERLGALGDRSLSHGDLTGQNDRTTRRTRLELMVLATW